MNSDTNGEITEKSPRLRQVGGKDGISGQFFVPSYQRGYRWGRHEVEALLTDIHAEGKRAPSDKYCLQPVVAKWRDNEHDFELIDGQQRLTTLYLIYRYLQKELGLSSGPRFSLTYETRPASQEYVQNLDVARMGENIDFFHMYSAYECIKDWFAETAEKLGLSPQLIGYAVYNYLETLVYIIWYEPDNIDATTLFVRLNVGRIALTNAELVKALLLSKDRDARAEQRRIEIGSQWDAIEQELNQPEFWAFLTNSDGTDYPTKIELLFDLMSKRPTTEKDKFYTFIYFKNMLDGSGSPDTPSIWDLILQYYQVLREWYEDRDLYHKLGYLIATGTSLRQLLDTSERLKTKSAFNDAIDGLIRTSLSLSEESLKELSYGDQKCEKVLLLFNVETVRRLSHSSERYPFHTHKGEKWSLEHIHAQNADELRKAEEWRHWLEDSEDALKKLRPSETVEQHDRDAVVSEIGKVLSGAVTESRFTRLARRVMGLLAPGGEDDSINSIANLALLSRSINSSLSNSAFAVKRLKVIDHDRQGSFIPICTRQVFLKYFADTGGEQMHFWSRRDQESYLETLVSADRGIGQYLIGTQ